MGLFTKKNIQTKTFVDGQEQEIREEPAEEKKKIGRPSKLPPPPPPPVEDDEETEEEEEKPQPKEPKAEKIILQPGFYYWLDDYGEVCLKPIRRQNG